MSVFNRKMFKPRNARNALSMSAGIMPVQKFHAGGPVGHTHIINAPPGKKQVPFYSPPKSSVPRGLPAIAAARNASPALNARMNILQGRGTAPLRQTMMPGSGTMKLDPNTLSGISSILSRSPPPKTTAKDVMGGGLKSMVTNPNPMTVGQETRSDILGAIATPIDAVVGAGASGAEAIRDLLSPLTSSELTPGFVNAVVTGKQALPDSVKQQINNRQISVPTVLSEALLSGKIDTTGIDLAKLSGFQSSQEAADVVEIMNAAPGSQTVAVERPVPPETELGRDPGPVEDEAIAALAPPPGTGDLSQDRMFMGDADAPVKPVLPETELGRDPGPVERDAAATTDLSQKEIDRVINSGTKEEQQSTLDGFIKEFMDKAPGYEGADSGLILAKIGFAMAAGKSPNAIENIASAMSDGADMLIKDKAKKDEFNRQLKLSAMQYGLGENSKLRTQQRSDDRNLLRLVGEDGQAARISMTDLLANDGKLPKGFQDVDVYLAQEKAALERRKTVNAGLKSAREELLISDEQSSKISENYNKFSKRYIDAEVGIEFAEKAMLTLADDGSITGIRGGAKDFGNKLMNAMGMDAPPSFESKAKYQSYVRQAFQKLIPVSLGGVQSANSISNVDVKFLADAYVDASTLQDGSFNLLAADPNILAEKMGFVINDFRRNQKAAALEMRGIEDRLSNRILPGQQTVGGASSLIAQQRQAAGQFGYGSDQGSGLTVNQNLGLVDTGKKNAQGMPIFKLPS